MKYESTKVEYLRYLAKMETSQLKQLFFEFKEKQKKGIGCA